MAKRVVGNQIDIDNARSILGDRDYVYEIYDPKKTALDNNAVIVGGAGAIGGVASGKENGAMRLWGQNSKGTIDEITKYAKANQPSIDDLKNQYLDQAKSSLTSKKSWMKDAQNQAQNQASLQYDDQVARLKNLAVQAKASLNNQLQAATPTYTDMTKQANAQAYTRQNDINTLLAKMGTINSGVGVGNTQLVQRDLGTELNNIERDKTNFTNQINSQIGAIDTNLGTDIESINQLKSAYVANALQQAEKDYQGYVTGSMKDAEDSFWKSQDYSIGREQMETQQRQFEQEFALKAQDLEAQIQNNRDQLSLQKEELAFKYEQARMDYMKEFGQATDGMSEKDREWLTKETARVQDMVTRAIAEDKPELIRAIIEGSSLPYDHKDAQLNLMVETYGYGTLGLKAPAAADLERKLSQLTGIGLGISQQKPQTTPIPTGTSAGLSTYLDKLYK